MRSGDIVLDIHNVNDSRTIPFARSTAIDGLSPADTNPNGVMVGRSPRPLPAAPLPPADGHGPATRRPPRPPHMAAAHSATACSGPAARHGPTTRHGRCRPPPCTAPPAAAPPDGKGRRGRRRGRGGGGRDGGEGMRKRG
uniref:Uncharacterized protein n=1 Tax=Oryza sativa subsp. japonica TaxID=39947 RepID=Q6L4Q3_ORYSJ|nr:hypothetical protein [Oryza sativa Japonica Group]